MRYNSYELYMLFLLLGVVIACTIGLLISFIRSHRWKKLVTEARREAYIQDLEKKCCFYRTQYEARNLLESADSAIAFNNMMQEAGKDAR